MSECCLTLSHGSEKPPNPGVFSLQIRQIWELNYAFISSVNLLVSLVNPEELQQATHPLHSCENA